MEFDKLFLMLLICKLCALFNCTFIVSSYFDIFMSLIVCQVCSTEHSVNAVNCPKCGHDRTYKPDKQKPCRICKTMLSAKEHRYVHHSQSHYISDGNSGVSNHYTFMHVTCYNCGEPFPLKCAMDNEIFRGLVKFFLMIISFLAACIFYQVLKAVFKLSDDNILNYFVSFIVCGSSYFKMREKIVGY